MVNTEMVNRYAAIERIVGGRNPRGAIDAYRLYTCDGLSLASVADRLGITRQAVHQRVVRVRGAMASIGISKPEAVEVIQSME